MIKKKAKKENPDRTAEATPILKTEGPLSEKDEQADAIEKTKELREEAKEKWEELKKKE